MFVECMFVSLSRDVSPQLYSLHNVPKEFVWRDRLGEGSL